MPSKASFYSHFTDEHSLVLDSMLALPIYPAPPLKQGVSHVAFGFQNKEHTAQTLKGFPPVLTDEDRGRHLLQMKGGPKQDKVTSRNVNKFLATNEFVHVLMTPNEPTNLTPTAKWNELAGRDCHEAIVTNKDIEAWSPMAAFSACDARVLESPACPVNPNQGDENTTPE